jgi:hypothetical protein
VAVVSARYLDAFGRYLHQEPADHDGLSPEDRDLEARIEQAYDRMLAAPTVEDHAGWCARMAELIDQRSPRAVAAMERAMGLSSS